MQYLGFSRTPSERRSTSTIYASLQTDPDLVSPNSPISTFPVDIPDRFLQCITATPNDTLSRYWPSDVQCITGHSPQSTKFGIREQSLCRATRQDYRTHEEHAESHLRHSPKRSFSASIQMITHRSNYCNSRTIVESNNSLADVTSRRSKPDRVPSPTTRRNSERTLTCNLPVMTRLPTIPRVPSTNLGANYLARC